MHDNFADYDAHLKLGEGPTDWNKFFKDFKRYTPDARLVLEYASGPIPSIVRITVLYHNRGITALTKLVRRPFAVFVPRVCYNG